jgi:amino acid transporter
MIIKFVPIIFCMFAGILVSILEHGTANPILPPDTNPISTPLSNSFLPYLAVFSIIPALFFSFDGFYASSTLQRDMKEPKKLPTALVVALLIVAFFDLIITISLCIGTKTGNVAELKADFDK